MKHEFPLEVINVAKRLGVTDSELNAMYQHFSELALQSKLVAQIKGDDIALVLDRINKHSISDIDTIEFTEKENEFLNSIMDGNPCNDLTEAMQWCIDQCVQRSQTPLITIEWFPIDLPPKDGTIVLGEDAEGASYIVKYIDGGPRECLNVMECEHPDHNKISDGKCREMKEGFYEVVEQFTGELGYVEVRREIVKWRPIPKSNN